MTEGPKVSTVADNRRPAHGWSRILVGVYAVFGLVITGPALVSLIRFPERSAVVGALDLIGGLLYLLLAVCLAHNGRRMRMIGWMTLSALLTTALLIGLLTLAGISPELKDSVWSVGGRPRGYLPLLLPVVAGVWMWLSDPRRIVANAERMTDLSDSLAERRTKGR
ncbi:Uncharacterised protein [Actinomyces bovis]|uniref:Uncharacterized protein n=1 Tax=Actinomyces bovis TaxID=1658 RepID=A0ABY1VR15_9ACTO|nr:hypothetical protein [Actinomyces bovis]SPT54111.1 Uncharacterised protein [Actinomyces bovis]VEG53652.1 Uncharacterised protein [Actinomyces israelii]